MCERILMQLNGHYTILYTRYSIVARALGLAALGRVRARKGILHKIYHCEKFIANTFYSIATSRNRRILNNNFETLHMKLK